MRRKKVDVYQDNFIWKERSHFFTSGFGGLYSGLFIRSHISSSSGTCGCHAICQVGRPTKKGYELQHVTARKGMQTRLPEETTRLYRRRVTYTLWLVSLSITTEGKCADFQPSFDSVTPYIISRIQQYGFLLLIEINEIVLCQRILFAGLCQES